jgi:MFS family permease
MTMAHKDSAGYSALLRDRGFMALMATVFLGAITDNIFRIIVALFATRLAADAGDSSSLALGSALFVVPYLLFSGYAGWLADRFDKRKVLIVVKSMEILAMALGYWALLAGRMDMMLAVIFLTALQSALSRRRTTASCRRSCRKAPSPAPTAWTSFAPSSPSSSAQRPAAP